jgi:cell division protein FtsA
MGGMAVKREGGEILVGLDIGTTKVAAVVGEVTDQGVEVIGIGQQLCRGSRKGLALNIEQTAASIKETIREAEQMAGCQIGSVHVGISGPHVQGLDMSGLVAVKGGEVTAEDVDRVKENARAFKLPQDREILHVLPQDYIIDGQDGIREPVGISGVRLEAKVHVITVSALQIQNILKCCRLCDLQVDSITLEHLAAAEAVLQDGEKELGVALIDIGGALTNMAIYVDGTLRHTAVTSMGGGHITNDIRVGLRTIEAEAERLKKTSACALGSMVDPEETILVPRVGPRQPEQVPRSALCAIVSPRVEEILSHVQQEIEKSGYGELLAGGVVLTGGGAMLKGLAEMAEQVMQTMVRVGQPMGFGGMVDMVQNPSFAAASGLLLMAARRRGREQEDVVSAAKPGERSGRSQRFWETVKRWF